MHLASKKRQKVRVAGRMIEFRAGETIHTENSYKYTLEAFGALARGSGWKPVGGLDRRQAVFLGAGAGRAGRTKSREDQGCVRNHFVR